MNMQPAKVIVQFIFRVVFIGLVLILLASAYSFSYHFMYRAFGNVAYEKENEKKVTVTVADDDTNAIVATHLEQAGVVEDRKSTLIRIQLSKYKDGIKPGSYELSASMPLDDILRVLSKEEAVVMEDREE